MMNVEALKAKHLLEETDCFHCKYYYNDECIVDSVRATLPEELSCMAFEAGVLDAEEKLKEACNQEMKVGIDKMIMDIVNGN